MENQRFTPGDPILIENIVSYLKAKGIFDEFRHECLADVDTKSSCQNLSQRVDGYTTKFLSNETWNPDLNKNELRNKLRRHIDESGMLAVGADHVVEQVINPKIGQLFLPRIIEVVHQYLKEENEKLTKQQTLANENSSTLKTSENIEAGSKKTPILDPIADILSFTYSKPKPVSQTTSQKFETAAKKSAETSLKTEKKKDESFKSVDIKIEKKDDDNAGIVNTSDITIKTEKKEDTLPVKGTDISAKSEKVSEDFSEKPEATELSNDSLTLSSKTQTDSKESVKLKKEIKIEESDIQTDFQKKVQREDSKPDKRKMEDLKLNEDNTNLEDNQSKAVSSISKASTQNKPKHDSEKSKKIKTHSSPKVSSHSSDQRKFKSKEFSDKTSSEKHSKSSSKTPKLSSKDSSSLSKSNTSKSIKKEKSEDSNIKKHTVTHSSKSVDSSLRKSTKSSSSKKENPSTKSKYLLDSNEKQKSSNKHSAKSENLSEQSNTEKGIKTTLQHSSSYESSQGSDQDKSCHVVSDAQKKTKYYSKHHKRENLNKKTSGKSQENTSNSKKSHKESDYSVKKHDNEKSLKMNFQKKLKETTVTHDFAKISSRSNSFGSTSSTSDSSNISKDILPSSSEDTNENSAKYVEKKKKTTEKDRCITPQNLPPPPPPPPPPSDSLTIDATSSSPEEATQSSQESESEFETGDESSTDSDDSCSSSVLQTSGHNSGVDSSDLNEVYNILMCSSSSSEFEGFCSSPEKSKEKSNASDISVSSVHTSDLSSYEDEISAEDISSEDLPHLDGKKGKKKLSVKEAQELLQKKAKQTSVATQNSSVDCPLSEEKSPEVSSQKPSVFISSEEEVSPHPRRELRRERKLNPKYASNEYTSIFNSKRTSFITKQPNQYLQTQSVNSSRIINTNNTSDFRETISKENVSNETSPKCANTTKERYSGIVTDKKISSNSNSSTSKIVAHVNEISDTKESLNSFEAERNISSSEFNDNNLKQIDSAVQLTLEMKNSTLKTKNNISKHLNPYGVKRKFDGPEKNTNKRLCNRNSIDTNSTKRLNENKLLNEEKNDKTCISSSESKSNLQKPKANGDVLRKIDHLRKSSHSNLNRSSNKK